MGKPARLTAGFVAGGMILALCYALQPGESIAAGIVLLICLGTCVALIVGPRVNDCQARRPWTLFMLSGFSLMLGVLSRPWAAGLGDARMLIADAFTLVGYALLIAGLVVMLRAVGSLDRHAVLDGLIVVLGTAAPAVQYLALPAAAIDNRPQVVSWVAAVYPTIDIVVLFIVINLAFSTAVRLPSFRLVVGCVLMMLIGDFGYAILGSKGQLVGPPILDVALLLSFVSMGAASLHPSMTGFAKIVSQPIQPWSPLRLGLIIPALAAPFVVLIDSASGNVGQSVAAGLSAVLTLALVVRAVSAVTRLAETQAKWLYQATHDELTGLPNRASLVAAVDQRLATAAAGQTWIAFVDLDGFKLVNDHWGHSTGDRLLQEVSQRLLGLAAGDWTVSRTGGDEFAIAGSGGPERAVEFSTRVLELLRRPVYLHGLELITTGSLGVVVHADQPSAEELLRDADLAMYRSKDAGHDRWTVFEVAMRDPVRHRVEIELALRHALQNDELWIAYQPLVRLADDAVIGAEALVRWAHPQRGAIAPNDFISVAEETGMIRELGTWVLQNALRQLADWRAAEVVGDDFGLSVNVSAHQLGDSLLCVVQDALAKGHLRPGCLTIELTESALMADADEALRVLTTLRELGVMVSVDDFGTGYSSLSYLSTLPVSGVKIDRSFVRHLGERPQAEVIARAIVAMSDSLILEVTAEGVETPAQRQVVRDLGVAKGQGWLWGKAVDSLEFADTHFPAERRLSRRSVPAGVGGTRTPSTAEYRGAASAPRD